MSIKITSTKFFDTLKMLYIDNFLHSLNHFNYFRRKLDVTEPYVCLPPDLRIFIDFYGKCTLIKTR